MRFQSISRNGLVTFKFNQECKVPNFMKNLEQTSYKKLNVQEDIIRMDIRFMND
jgi:hypothetical protein